MPTWQTVARHLTEQRPASLREGASPRLPLDVLVRLESAGAYAAEKADIVNVSVRRHLKKWGALFERIQAGKLKKRDALLQLRQCADELSQATYPASACRAKCTHCCHIPVVLAQCEANLIGSAIERPAQRLPAGATPLEEYGYHNPCTFLSAQGCTIYAERPLACRLHFNMDQDDLLCRLIPGETVPLPLLNTMQFQAVYAFLTFGESFGDIRHFFPSLEAPNNA